MLWLFSLGCLWNSHQGSLLTLLEPFLFPSWLIHTWYEGLCLLLLPLVILCSVYITGRSSLFWKETEEQKIWGRGKIVGWKEWRKGRLPSGCILWEKGRLPSGYILWERIKKTNCMPPHSAFYVNVEYQTWLLILIWQKFHWLSDLPRPVVSTTNKEYLWSI